MLESLRLPIVGTVLGFDVGQRRIGVALGHTVTRQARRLTVITVGLAGPAWSQIDQLSHQWGPQGLIVGDPLTGEGFDQPARRRAWAFARQLRQRYGVSVGLVDERSSSQEAARCFAQARAQGHARQRDSVGLDAAAAAIIVERWLIDPSQALFLL